MSKVIFTYKGIFVTIECDVKEKIKDICAKFIDQIGLYKEEIIYLYNEIEINEMLTFEELANESDKERKTINIIVKELNDIKIKYNKKEKSFTEYKDKINYKFLKNPNLKYKQDITDINEKYGLNDLFEVFLSFQDNKEYIASPNINYNIDIFLLYENKKILSLEGHDNKISTIRYFINNKDNKEFLISADKNKIVIIWEISNNYNIKYKIETKYKKIIYSCLLVFPININKKFADEGFIITSSNSVHDDVYESATKIYSFDNSTFLRYIHNTNNIMIWYLLSWYNKNNNNYYVIQLGKKHILIDNMLEDELYADLVNEPEHNHYSGFIYNENDNDYLCTSSQNGFIHIWDLYNKKIFKIINVNQCNLLHMIQWNDNLIIVADSINKSFKVIDLQINKVISNFKGQHLEYVFCIKKIYHPIYGESLLSASEDNQIKLWTI